MKVNDLIDKCIAEKIRCFVNGMDGGYILKREEDYIEFQTLEVEVEKKTQKERTTKEIVVIPIDKIDLISFGEQKDRSEYDG